MSESAYSILQTATQRQLRNLDELRSDIRERRTMQAKQQTGPEIQGGFLEGDIAALEREYQQARSDIFTDYSNQVQILREQEKAARERAKAERGAGIGGVIGGVAGAIGGTLLGVGPVAGYSIGSGLGSAIGGNV